MESFEELGCLSWLSRELKNVRMHIPLNQEPHTYPSPELKHKYVIVDLLDDKHTV